MSSRTKTLTQMTLAQAFERYRGRVRHRALLSPVTISDTKYVLTRYAKEFWDRPLASITAAECRHLFEQLTKVGPVAANRTMGCLRAVINVARDELYGGDDGKDRILEFDNPVTLMLRHVRLNPVQIRRGRIPADRVRAVWQALKQLGEGAAKPATRTAADWLRFRMMTGTRPADSRELRYSHIDWEHNLIEVPRTMTENHRPLILPMTPQMRELIMHRRAMHLTKHPGEEPAPDAFIFDSDTSTAGHIMSARATLEAVAGPEITEFDIRRTFAAVASECGICADVTRRLLNLAGQDDVARRFHWDTPGDLLDALTRIAHWLDRPESGSLPPGSPK